MPTIDPTLSGRQQPGEVFTGETLAVSWVDLANGDDGAYITYGSFADRSIQVQGTFGAGGTLLVEGSNDGTNFHTLTTPLGTALSITAAGIYMIAEPVKYIRPRVSAGDGTTELTATLFARSQ